MMFIYVFYQVLWDIGFALILINCHYLQKGGVTLSFFPLAKASAELEDYHFISFHVASF
jgi:hypothetical protein